MDLLWQKKRDWRGERFVDLFDEMRKTDPDNLKIWDSEVSEAQWIDRYLLVTKSNAGKDSRKSISLDAKGKAHIKLRNWFKAMYCFNRSLCFAPKGTNVSTLYMSRAFCFLRLGEYEKSLKDIELAKKANYPVTMMLLLSEVEAHAKNRLRQHPTPPPYEPKLSSEASELFPSMADVLEIQRSDQFGRHIVAKADIPVGQTILIEEIFVGVAACEAIAHCFQCLRTMQNLIPCTGCSDAMFCSDDCRERCEIHKISCRAGVHRMPKDIAHASRSILQALHLFANADDLMEFVARTMAGRSTSLPTTSTDALSRYEIFVSLLPAPMEWHLTEHIYIIYRGLMRVSYVRKMFHKQYHKRFLMHLVAEHYLIIRKNSFGGPTTGAQFVGETGLVLSFFNHSCAANVFNSSIGDKSVCITMRPIKRGDQLFIKYLHRERNDEVKREKLLKNWEFNCACERCVPVTSDDQRCEMMETDENYTALRRLRVNSTDIIELTNRCVAFLTKYGDLPWTPEMEDVLWAYTKCLLYPFPNL